MSRFIKNPPQTSISGLRKKGDRWKELPFLGLSLFSKVLSEAWQDIFYRRQQQVWSSSWGICSPRGTGRFFQNIRELDDSTTINFQMLNLLAFWKKILFCMYDCWPVCSYVHYMYARCPWRPEEVARSLRTGDTDHCELPCGSLELILGPLQEQEHS